MSNFENACARAFPNTYMRSCFVENVRKQTKTKARVLGHAPSWPQSTHWISSRSIIANHQTTKRTAEASLDDPQIKNKMKIEPGLSVILDPVTYNRRQHPASAPHLTENVKGNSSSLPLGQRCCGIAHSTAHATQRKLLYEYY